THGRPNDVNAHPHLSEEGRLAAIHNGIIENYQALKRERPSRGHVCASETDTEALAHPTEARYAVLCDRPGAVRSAPTRVEGAYALVVTHVDHDLLVAARNTSPLVIGLGEGETYLASDVPALLPYTREVVYLLDGDVAVLRAGEVTITDLSGRPVERESTTVAWDAEAAEKAGYPHYMLKEIYEQPTVLQNTLFGRFTGDGLGVDLGLGLDPAAIDRVVITAAGTASYAGMVGQALIERLARLPATTVVSSEFRYSDPVVDGRTLVVAVPQPGETIDTLEAVRGARRRGARTPAVLTVKGASLSREVDDALYIHAGPEIGVASTKAYTAMVAAVSLLALWLGRARGTAADDLARELVRGMRELPKLVERALRCREEVARIAQGLLGARSALYLGRGVNVATAMEGALKLKEISYVHAEAYPTGEMKHGPIALIDETMPVIAVATASALYDKTVSNLQEVKARDGRLIVVANEGDERVREHADEVIYVPATHELLSPVVNVVPLQLLAYEVASRLGRDVDQ